MSSEPTLIDTQGDRRLIVAISAILALAFFFWLDSRYPALNEKAIMGGDTPIAGLAFDIIIEIFPNSGIWWELVANTVNWVYTNLKGMSFGVLFGAAVLTLLSLIKRRSFENGFANSALGTVIGAPLGVCVNCAAPIALGLHVGRMRLETTLSALLASPTLNVIVVTMSFALLPMHMAVIKLVLALTMVLIVIPLLCKFVLKHETVSTRNTNSKLATATKATGFTAWIAKALAPVDVATGKHGFLASLKWFAKTYARSFFFIFIITVPMMFLAAILGAVVATFTAPTELAGIFPTSGAIAIIAALILITGVASFVPAPIALDVILTTILINIGMKSHYAMATLIALGSFSIYAFIILWRAISLRTGIVLWLAVIGISVTGGVLAKLAEPYVAQYYRTQQIAAINAVDKIDYPVPAALPKGKKLDELQPILERQKLTPTPVAADIVNSQGSRVTIAALPLPTKIATKTSDEVFTRINGTQLGLLEKGVNAPEREYGYHIMLGAIAAGDIHGDGWVDVITRRPPHANGLSLYTNIGGRFALQALDLGPVNDSEVFNLAMADVDGDSQLDLLVSTIRNGEYLFFNEGGKFSTNNMTLLYEPGQTVLASIGFADMDQDGDTDIIAGKWAPRGASIGWGLQPFHNRNQIYWNEGDRQFRKQIISDVGGQTLTLLISDFNGDGYLDVFNGDDAGLTDGVTFFGPKGKIRESSLENQPFPYYTISSMSYTQGDWNNDLQTDYYGAQIAIATAGEGKKPRDANNRVLFEICSQFGADIGWSRGRIQQCSEELLSIDAIQDGKLKSLFHDCSTPSLARDRALCGAVAIVKKLANKTRKLSGDIKRFKKCQSYFNHMPEFQKYCDSLKLPVAKRLSKQAMKRRYRESFGNANILMTANEDGAFIDNGSDANVRSPGWSWNSRFTDLDQDGRQDILVMTGIWMNSASSTTNMFYHNNGNGFVDATEDFGFYDVVPSYSYVAFDYDRDGDVDIIRDNSGMRMIVHRNEKPAGPALFIRLRDSKGNRLGIGATVTICTDGETEIRPGPCQMRVIKASGGFMSSDPIAAHFGLGNANDVSLIQIQWSGGEISTIKPRNLLNGEIEITRD